jgi:hypothetical protein
MDTAIPGPIAEALSRYPDPVRARLLEIRALVFEVARDTEGVGPLAETLKWGEPAYLTEVTKSGTTIRLGASKLAPEAGAVFFHCRTTLVETFRSLFSDEFAFEGNRALIVPVLGPLLRQPLKICLRAALTYHLRKDPTSV